MLRVALAAVALLLAGCAAPAIPGTRPTAEDPAPASAVPLPPARLAYACPWPGAATRTDGLCVGTLASPGESLAEPDLAVSPLDPKTIAMGVNVFGSGAATAGAAQSITVFVSRDGGASWTRVTLPEPPFPAASHARVAADPSLVFDASGALHLVALAGGLDAGYVVYHARSEDGGATWDSQVHRTAGGPDEGQPWANRLGLPA